MQCGLLGGKLSHSYSPQIHGYLCDYTYDIYEKKPEELEEFLTNGNFSGVNVTIPYKKAVIPYCAELSETARKLGAVNTLVRRADGTLVGHNTDYFGFASMLNRSGITVSGKKVLVLGSGGASATVVAVLEELDANVIIVSRTGQNNYQNLDQHMDAAVIVNTTPVGMYPNVGNSPIDLDQFPSLEGVLDVVYNPARTQLLMDAEKRNLITMNGLWMLVAQAKESAEWFSGQAISDDKIAWIYKKLRKQMENTILIGMPGCGKSTIGMALAKKLNKTFVDADFVIEEMANKSIPEIFALEGEGGFRTWETKALSSLGKQSGLVIATGGGCVTKKENYPLLHQNGTIYWLQRDIELLATDGRPLSKSGKLPEMYTKRQPMYTCFADHAISNDGSISDTVHKICQWEVKE